MLSCRVATFAIVILTVKLGGIVCQCPPSPCHSRSSAGPTIIMMSPPEAPPAAAAPPAGGGGGGGGEPQVVYMNAPAGPPQPLPPMYVYVPVPTPPIWVPTPPMGMPAGGAAPAPAGTASGDDSQIGETIGGSLADLAGGG